MPFVYGKQISEELAEWRLKWDAVPCAKERFLLKKMVCLELE
jgi:hypothetical protein